MASRSEMTILEGSLACPSCNQPTIEPRCPGCGAALMPGGYRTRRIISESASGRIYLADAPNKERVALKEIVFRQIPDFATIDALEREARVLRQLNHRRIPRYIDSFTEGQDAEQRFYLAQTFVEGRTLAEWIPAARFTEQQVKLMAVQVLDVLIYLQSLSPPLAHRNLRPSSLMWRPDGEIIVVGFGAVRDAGNTQNGTMLDAGFFAPPEQGVGIVDPTSDIYALAMTMMQLLNGPSVERALVVASHVEPDLAKWITKATAHDPGARHRSALEAMHALPSVLMHRRRSGLAVNATMTIGLAISTAMFGAGYLVAALSVPVLAATPVPRCTYERAEPVSRPLPVGEEEARAAMRAADRRMEEADRRIADAEWRIEQARLERESVEARENALRAESEGARLRRGDETDDR